jgi:hypothetical protein
MAFSKTRSSALLSDVTVAATSSSSNSSSSDLTYATACAVEVKCTFAAGATNGAIVHIYASGNNTDYDTGAYDEFDIPVTAGETVQYTFPIIPSPKYIKIGVENLDPVESITALYVYTVIQVVS